MEDGSSVRIKVAQYFVNKKLQELESKKAELEIDDLTLLQALPPPEYRVDEPTNSTDELTQPELPPLFPSLPRDKIVSWESVLKDFSTHQPKDDSRWPMPPPWYRVAIIGAGVAGPPLATLLKMKGYDPVMFERIDGPSTGGLALGYVSALVPSFRTLELIQRPAVLRQTVKPCLIKFRGCWQKYEWREVP